MEPAASTGPPDAADQSRAPKVNVIALYNALFSDIRNPCEAAAARAETKTDYFTGLEPIKLQSGHIPVPEAPSPDTLELRLDRNDLASLLCLETLLKHQRNSKSGTRYVVVDECQDVAPLELWLLNQFSETGWCTLMGDLAQSVRPDPDFERWDQLDTIFGSPQHEKLTRSYRSPEEITRSANAVLQRVSPGTELPQSFLRHGIPHSISPRFIKTCCNSSPSGYS